MTIDLDAIEAAARGATPGEWKSERRTSTEYYINTGPEPRLYIHSWQGMASVYGQEDDDEEVSNAVASANAHHIATMDPQTTLALVERVRELESAARDAEVAAEEYAATRERGRELEADNEKLKRRIRHLDRTLEQSEEMGWWR